jgi:hypothetical protein
LLGSGGVRARREKLTSCWQGFTAGFTEEFDTKDLQEANMFLAELSAQ